MWGDDGCECPFDANWPALALYGELCYEEKKDMNMVKKFVKAVAKDDWDTFINPAKIDEPDGAGGGGDKGQKAQQVSHGVA